MEKEIIAYLKDLLSYIEADISYIDERRVKGAIVLRSRGKHLRELKQDRENVQKILKTLEARGKTGRKPVDVETARECWELHRQGMSFRKIADELNLSASTVHKYVQEKRKSDKRIIERLLEGNVYEF